MSLMDPPSLSMVHRFGSLSRAVIAPLLILALTATLFFALYQHHRFRGLTDATAMEHAQLGSILAEERVYHTRLLRPIAISTLAQRHPDRGIEDGVPELGYPPLYPAMLGFAFRIVQPDFTVQPQARAFSPETRVLLPLGWIFTLATAMLIFLVADRFFDRRIAALVPLAYLLSHTVLERTLSGLPDAMATFVISAAFVAALRAARRDSGSAGSAHRAAVAAIVAGFLSGLAVLTDYSLILMAPAPLIACSLAADTPVRRGLVIGLFTATLLIVLTPWMMRNIQLSGHPFGLAHLAWYRDSAIFPANRIDRALAWNPAAIPLGAVLRARWLNGLSHAGWTARWFAGMEAVFPALALAAFWLVGMPRQYRLLRWPILSAAILLLAVEPVLAGTQPGRFLYPLLPWIVLLGCVALIRLLDRMAADWPIIRQTVCTAVLLFHATPMIATLLGPRPPLPYPPLYPPFVAAVCALVEDDELMVSDLPWATAWYGNQRTLWLPNTLDEFYAVNDQRQTVAALYLTTETTGRAYVGDLWDGAHSDWLPFVEGRLPEGFPLTDALQLPPGRRDQIVFIGPGRIVAEPSVE